MELVNKGLLIGGLGLITVGLAGCGTDADVASKNISKAAEYFEIDRRIVFYNGITDSFILQIDGKCSLDDYVTKMTVTCKTGPSKYKKHYLGRSDNVTYFAEQIDSANVSAYHHRVVFKPQSIVPDIEIRTSITDNP